MVMLLTFHVSGRDCTSQEGAEDSTENFQQPGAGKHITEGQDEGVAVAGTEHWHAQI